MFLLRIIFMALRSLRANLLRSLLATLGVIIGVGAVIAANAVLVGAKSSFEDSMESMGSNLVTVWPEEARRGGRPVGAYQTLEVSDVDAIKAESKNIRAILPEVSRRGQIKYFNKNDQVQIVGTTEDYLLVFNLQVADGRFLESRDVQAQAKVAVLGHSVARELFGDVSGVGKHVKLGIDKTTGFEIVGVLAKKGQKGYRDMDELVMIPVSTAQSSVVRIRHIDAITALAVSADRLTAMEEDVKRTLRRLHRIRAGDEDDFRILNPDEFRNMVNQYMVVWAIVLYTISGISLIVGGIGIMNIMLVSVTERTREIGVRIAVGARAWDILRQFLVESSAISLAGGALGVLGGIAMADLITQVTSEQIITKVTPLALLLALAMAVVVGVVSGIYPAYKASQLDPVEALRYE